MYGVWAQGTLFPMCGMNLAFNRELIGPAMYFGLMGDGQPLGRYDDMWAGWCSKVGLAQRSADRSSFLNAVSQLMLHTSAPNVLLWPVTTKAAVSGRSFALNNSATTMHCSPHHVVV